MPLQDAILSYIVQAVMGVIIAILTGSYNKLAKRLKLKESENEAIKKGVREVLHLQLYKECQELLEAGSVAPEDLKNVEKIYENYHALGGNGTGTALYERILKLPITIDDRKDDNDA